MYLAAHLASAKIILSAYDGAVPFAAWLKTYFREHKKFGSRDRKLVADLCFCYFRLGVAFRHHTMEERLLLGQALCHENSLFVKELKNEWQPVMPLPLKEKLAFFSGNDEGQIFPLASELSGAVEAEVFQLSFLRQPDLFLRLRPNKEKVVLQKLQQKAVPFQQSGACLRLPNSTKIEEVVTLDEEAVVQDISSQQVLRSLVQHYSGKRFSAWDCCAASGGKTILLHDHYPSASLTATDIRQSILVNLRSRLKRAGLPTVKSFVADVAAPQFSMAQTFDVIICDAPCSGSGTWSRTPEQLLFFRAGKIEDYAALQKKVAYNASRCLKPGGFFLYITCSVFYRENEDVVAYLQQAAGLRLISQEYLIGYDKKGDTLFAALFTA